MVGGAGSALGGEDALAFRRDGAGVQEALPDDLHGGRRRMNEVLGIEPIVPQLVHHNLVRRKIADAGVFNRQMQG